MKRLILAFSIGLVLPASAAIAQPVMKIGLATINDGQHELAKRFAAEVEKKVPGKVKIQIYPADQLGSGPRLIEGLTLGTVEGWIGPPEFLATQDPRYQVMGAPGLFSDMDHGYRALKDPALRKALLSFGDARGIKGIGAIVNGPNFYASRKPLRSLADFKGLKIRVFGSPMHTAAMDKLGATGVPMAPGDALIALGSGAIDANRTAMSLLVAFKYFDVVKSATVIPGDALIFVVFVVAKGWYDKLPAEVQKAMLESAAGVEDDVRKFVFERQRAAEAAWKGNAAQIFEITGAEQAQFVQQMLTVGDTVTASNPRIKDAYNLLVERAKATRK
jgi:C4-dicarboxylate-binding protein DctP